MRWLRFLSALLSLALVYAGSPAVLHAGFVDAGVVSGPGGSGIANAFVSSTLAEPSLTYTSMGYLDLSFTVDSAGTYQINEAPLFGGVNNSTGTTWGGFTWELLSGPSPALVYSPGSPSFSGIDFSSTFTNATGTSTFATFAGGTLPSGLGFQPNFDIAVSGPGTFVIRETPLPVPEPSTFALAALGTCALLAIKRR